jgi:hypothetical protein
MELVRPLARQYAEHRFTVLFAMLMLAIVGHAPVGAVLPAANPLDLLLGLSLIAVVLGTQHPRLRWILGGLAAVFVAVRLADPFLDHPAPLHVSQLMLMLACLLAGGVALRRALAFGPVDAEHLFAALDAYLLVGIAFGAVYFLMETAFPGSFSPGLSEALTQPRAVYFSFVTQATLGYGDIFPVREHAQGIVIAQAVGGQIYLAVLVARLVSLYSAQGNR